MQDFFDNLVMGMKPEKGYVQLYRPAAKELLWFIEWLAKNRPETFDEAQTHPAQRDMWIANLRAALEEPVAPPSGSEAGE